MNRWTSGDPAGLVDGPNMYHYVKEDPINAFDSLGLQLLSCRRRPKPKCHVAGRYAECDDMPPLEQQQCEAEVDNICENRGRVYCCLADFSHCSVCNEACTLTCMSQYNKCLNDGNAFKPPPIGADCI